MTLIPFTTGRLIKPTRLYLMRHGQVRGHDEKRINGHDDVELTEEGIAQSHRLGQRLRGERITALYSSDLRRSLEGARIIAHYLDITPAPPLAEFREKKFGVFEGLNLKEIKERFAVELDELMNNWIGYCPPGAESLRELEQRVMQALQNTLERHQGERIALVGHGGVNRMILLHALGLELKNFFCFEQDYGCLNILDYYPQGAVVRLVNGL
ncbi:MAG: histidine phosphatase family protein [Deltaproteobacteria bacterium]|nr:histidine phosphatase family protein [Deltaproteobacteria bacterium]